MASQRLAEILELLQRPLALEEKQGCLNRAVFGGMDRYVLRWVEQGLREAADARIRQGLETIRSLFQDYGEADPRERHRRLRALHRHLASLRTLLEGSPAEALPAAPTPPEEPKARPPSPRKRPPSLDDPVQFLKGVGERRAQLLRKRFGVETVGQLFQVYPLRHEDRSRITLISQAQHGHLQTFYGVVVGVEELNPRRGLTLVKVSVTDGNGLAQLTFFNQPYMKERFKPGQRLIFSGRVNLEYGHVQVQHPEWEYFDEGDTLNTGRIVPIYPLAEGLTQPQFRRLMKNLVDTYADLVPEVLPPSVRERYALLPRCEALREFHFPSSWDALEQARFTLVFTEFFALQAALAQRRWGYHDQVPGIAFRTESRLVERLLERLPFPLTSAQERVLREILRDMADPHPMNRLLQGEVGSGKTLVALFAMLVAVENGYQAALMVPTEVLASQHAEVLRSWVEPLGVEVDLLIGSLPQRRKEEGRERIRRGETHIVVGTHALIQEKVDFARLGLVIVDEQHRFGVLQRAALRQKGYNPDVLVMTATPIPRTLALTVYGDLDVSILEELPPGRQPVETRWYPLSRRQEVYRFMHQELAKGRQAFVVCALIEESEALEAKAAIEVARRLQKAFPQYRVGLLHGRMATREKEEVMEAFRRGEVHLLTSTTVIEVGIDIPNATLMVVLNAERFGLAQLHQLRGRVGRGEHRSYCILLTDDRYDPSRADEDPASPYYEGRKRIQVMLQSQDGFTIAEQDLLLRGPGELTGTRQSGLPDLRLANLVRDVGVLETARQAAFELVHQDPTLSSPENEPLRHHLEEQVREKAEWVRVS